MDNLSIVIISDLHFGAFDSTKLMEELYKGFLFHLNKMKVLDLVVITGDLYDKKLSFNSQHVKMSIKFINDLIKICEEKGANLRIIKGTESHDNNQLDNLISFNSDCFRVIDKVEEETFYDLEIDVLYLPEEYMEDQNKFYQEYLDKKYNLIFGHGMVKEATFHATKQESAITMKKCPIFDTNKLLEISDYCFFGHIHTHQCIKKRFYYVGSYSVWCFGEEEDKGFMTLDYNKTNPDNSIINFIKNEYKQTFITKEVGIKEGAIENNITLIDRIISSLAFTKLRLRVEVSEDLSNVQLIINFILDYYNKQSNIKIEIVNKIEEKKRKQVAEQVDKMIELYGFIFDTDISFEEKIQIYIQKKFNKEMTIDKIKEYLYDK